MVGALDWLQDLIGGGGGGGTPPMPPMQGLDDRPSTPFPQGGDPMGGMGTPPLPRGTDPMTAGLKNTPDPMATQPMPPAQGVDLPSPAPYPQGGDPMNGMGSGNNGGLPPPSPPFAQGTDPMTAGGSPGNGPGLPPNMPVPPSTGMNFTATPRPAPNLPPPGPPTNITPTDMSAVQRMMPPNPDSGPQAKGIIGRALGLDPNREAQIRGSLGAGLKAAGENANKPGLAAFAGSMGSGIEGGKGAADKTADQQDRFLGRKMAANTQDLARAKSGSEATLNLARTQLALAQAKQAMAGGKESVVNSDQQLYLRAQSAAAQDGRLKVLKTAADQASTQFGPDSAQAKAAQKAHKDAYDATVEGHAKSLGLDPSKVAKVGKMPGMTADNPIDPKKDKLTQEKLNALPPGTHVVGPDGKVLVKKGPAGGNQPTSPQQQMTPSVPPTPPVPPVTAPAGSRADTEEED